MTGTEFDRDTLAKWYAEQHIKTDPGIRSVYYLPKNAPKHEIRFIEVNELIGLIGLRPSEDENEDVRHDHAHGRDRPIIDRCVGAVRK